MAVVSVRDALAGSIAAGSEVTVRGWVRTRRDSKAGLSFVALSQVLGLGGQVMVFFVMTVAAAEAAVGLAIILAIFRHSRSVDLKNINLLQG